MAKLKGNEPNYTYKNIGEIDDFDLYFRNGPDWKNYKMVLMQGKTSRIKANYSISFSKVKNRFAVNNDLIILTTRSKSLFKKFLEEINIDKTVEQVIEDVKSFYSVDE